MESGKQDLQKLIEEKLNITNPTLTPLAGLSNEVFLVESKGKKLVGKILREPNPFLHFERTRLNEVAKDVNFVIYADSRFRIEKYIENTEVTLEEAYDAKKSLLIFRALAEFNNLSSIKRPCFHVHQLLKDYESEILPRIHKNLASMSDSALQSQLEKQLDEVLDILGKLKPVSDEQFIAHNDFYYRNILFDTQQKRYRLIDFEYSHYNPKGYDLVNYINELLIDYNFPEFPYFKVSFEHLPSKEQMKEYAKFYIYYDKFGSALAKTADSHLLLDQIASSKEFASITEKQVEQLFDQFPQFFVAINCFWFIWALYYFHSPVHKFSYVQFAVAKFELIQFFLPGMKSRH